MAHHGFPTGFKEVWELLPYPQKVEVRLWHEPASAVPSGRQEQIDWLFVWWLFVWWRTLDAWVDERQRARA